MKDNILLIGAAILDVLVTPAGPEVFETGSYPAEKIQMAFGGDGLNESLVLSALGKKVYLNTVLGNDPEGEMIQLHCEKQGVVLAENCRKEGMQTGINVVLVEENGERNFLTNRNGSLRKLSKADIPMPFPEDVGVLCFASIFVSPEFGTADMADVFRQAKEQAIAVCADMTKRKRGETVEDIAEALKYVDYLIPNEEEAYLVTGADTPEKAAAVLQAAGVKNVVIKCGKKGCYVLEAKDAGTAVLKAGKGSADAGATGFEDTSATNVLVGEKYQVACVDDLEGRNECAGEAGSKTRRSYSGMDSAEAAEGYYVLAVPGVQCVDTTGAGDSFAAGFVYGISEGWNVRRCAEFANQCGAKAVAQVGATTWCANLSSDEEWK